MVSYFVYYTTRILRNAAMLSACLSVSACLSGPRAGAQAALLLGVGGGGGGGGGGGVGELKCPNE